MNKIFKYILIGLGIGSIAFATICSFCDAGLVGEYPRTSFGSVNSNRKEIDAGTGICFAKFTSNNMYYSLDGGATQQSMTEYTYYCFTGTVYLKGTTQSLYYLPDLPLQTESCPSCPTCEECEECTTMTSLECQTEYNLIPISSVTQSYCELNYNLIDPSTCPIYDGTGVVNWSSLFINNTQYAGNDNIEIFIPDFIGWSIVYNTGTNYIDVEGYNADTNYIEDVINKTKVTPTPEDASKLVNGLQEFIPYVMISMLAIFFLYLIRKVHK